MSAVATRPPRAGALTGTQKAAILCLALGAEASARILQQLGPEDVEQLSREIARTGMVPGETVDAVLLEYRDVLRTVEQNAEGGAEYARQMLETALGGARARSVFDRITKEPEEIGLSRFRRASPDVLHSVLRGEHPQTVALVLAHIAPKLASGVLEAMGPEQAGEVLFRIAQMERVSPEVLQMVEDSIGARADLTLSQAMTAAGGPGAAARMLNQLAGGRETVLLDAVGSRDSTVASAIRNLMFVFEDLLLLESRSMQRVLRDVDSKSLALALKAASDDLTKHIFANMSERAAGALREEMELLGPVKVRDVEAAHVTIVTVVRDLQEAGEIQVERGDDEVIA
ncbi:MAG: flagellar motor switch protein FliG [Gemmatimonadetes bacterium]|nr:flagellar motor switch protein FliG [Gemmatimonadota bacterium]MBL0177526.1 flagellar motor switch protein FliG [Gemmatimonadota bacterium]